jgi:hypothetical protein
LVRHGPLTKVALLAPLTWVNDELARLGGFVLAGQANVLGAQTVVVSVHSPAWYLDRARLSLVDVSDVRLTQNADVWVADLVLAAIRALVAESRQVLVGGDFNLSPTFDAWRRGGRGNQEYLDRMATLGMVECLASSQGRLTPTFRNPRGGRVIHQIDHLFASSKLTKQLRSCEVPPAEDFFQRGLSAAVWKFVGGQRLAEGGGSCQALGSLRYSPQAQSSASSGAPARSPLGKSESSYPSRLAR